MTESQLRDALHEIEDVIAHRVDAGSGERPSASQALYLIDRIARGALHSEAGVDLMRRETMVGMGDETAGAALKLSA